MSEPTFTKLTDLAAERLGGKAVLCSDDFFAEKENLLKPGRGIFIPDKYTDRGKWMDGWESRRKRTPGHDWSLLDEKDQVDLAAAVNGARSIVCNDMFFSHMDNLILPGRGVNMGDGWETKRNRTPNNRDWVIVRLAHEGIIDEILIDTCHF